MNVKIIPQFNKNDFNNENIVVICTDDIGEYANPDDLAAYIETGGKVIFASGIDKNSGISDRLLKSIGITGIDDKIDCQNITFKKDLFPIQPENTDKINYNGKSASTRLELPDGAEIYVIDDENNVPLLYSYKYGTGCVCFINGAFLADIRYMGLLSGAFCIVQPDFIYPVLGVKTVFLDNFPDVNKENDDFCKEIYGYSEEGFISEVIWPSFQGISLRNEAPVTASVLVEASDKKFFNNAGDDLFIEIGKNILRIEGELIYSAKCTENDEVVFNEYLVDKLSKTFPDYVIDGLALENNIINSDMYNIPDTDIKFIRGAASDRDLKFSNEEGRIYYPAATSGIFLEDGGIFELYSVIASYGMISHVFDFDSLITTDNKTDVWDVAKEQLGIFESDILSDASYLTGTTLSGVGNNVLSYLDMDYDWTKVGNNIYLECSKIIENQTFYYHTDGKIKNAEGLSYQDLGNGYYLLKATDNHGTIVLEENA